MKSKRQSRVSQSDTQLASNSKRSEFIVQKKKLNKQSKKLKESQSISIDNSFGSSTSVIKNQDSLSHSSEFTLISPELYSEPVKSLNSLSTELGAGLESEPKKKKTLKSQSSTVVLQPTQISDLNQRKTKSLIDQSASSYTRKRKQKSAPLFSPKKLRSSVKQRASKTGGWSSRNRSPPGRRAAGVNLGSCASTRYDFLTYRTSL